MKKNFVVYVILVVAGIILIYYFLIFQGLQNEISTKEKSLTSKRNELFKANEMAKRVEELRREIDNLKIELDYMTEKLPSEKRISELLSKLQEVGVQSGVTFLRFKPGNLVSAELYKILSIDMEIIGSYHQIATFFNKIGSLSRIVNIFDVKLERDKSEEKLQIASFILKTYIYKEKAEETETERKGGTRR